MSGKGILFIDFHRKRFILYGHSLGQRRGVFLGDGNAHRGGYTISGIGLFLQRKYALWYIQQRCLTRIVRQKNFIALCRNPIDTVVA
mgnify:CR=1 FL=1